ncbi:gamma-glutamyltranspeptidase/glutathione hydrolase [Kribbella orskensis]|uniref:Gamma-glutamyltranspeptidase/glutathione hydrolase n=1 Tax=Kribbella orskensis TaxID=2512216 RepID=A0ABY2B7V8_9ACTN|nr:MULTISPECIES: gamma-glutamyltransferase [Kribbella]TCN30470.1 gamma-glutamyltranspeptidase/glutathione hydrolase [Kribbella sp. VKM Ac-2500]TCO11112.1 gamma-glutamyltranspeptidase/glutathione hydrolase [Kribbella orskensis]
MTNPRVAVAAPNATAAEAGVRLAAEGGNAVDAAIAATLVTMVNEIGVVSPASGGFVTLQVAGGEPVTIDGWVEMPGRGLTGERFGRGVWDVTTDYGGGTTTTVGHGSVATPGGMKALDLAHRRSGKAPWSEVVRPAIEVARQGFPLSRTSGYYLGYTHEIIFGWHRPSHGVVHDDDGVVIKAGTNVVIPELAEALELIASAGAETMYTGELAELLVRDMAANEGILTAEDLAAYEAIVRPALTVRQNGWTLATNPPPAVGGVAVAAMLALLDGIPKQGSWRPDELERLVDVQHAVLGQRLAELDVEDVRRLEAQKVLDLAAAGDLRALSSPSTATVSVVDDEGDACAITVSSGYGSGVMTPGTGIWLNNALGEQELVHGGPHSLTPGTRLTSNMAPSVARRDGDGAVLAISSPGSDRIPTAIAQVYALYTHGGLSLEEAVEHPRLHVRVRENVVVDFEEDLEVEGASNLPVRPMPPHSMYFGGVAAAFWDPADGLLAVGDPRRTGAIAVSPQT